MNRFDEFQLRAFLTPGDAEVKEYPEQHSNRPHGTQINVRKRHNCKTEQKIPEDMKGI